jgi:SAM-dependent methyltransferase
MRLLRPLLKPGRCILEIGCGSAALPFALADVSGESIGLVTDALIDFTPAPSHFRFVTTSGVGIPLADASIGLAHSDRLMEHLDIDDAEPQIREVYRILKPGWDRHSNFTPARWRGCATGCAKAARWFAPGAAAVPRGRGGEVRRAAGSGGGLDAGRKH